MMLRGPPHRAWRSLLLGLERSFASPEETVPRTDRKPQWRCRFARHCHDETKPSQSVDLQDTSWRQGRRTHARGVSPVTARAWPTLQDPNGPPRNAPAGRHQLRRTRRGGRAPAAGKPSRCPHRRTAPSTGAGSEHERPATFPARLPMVIPRDATIAALNRVTQQEGMLHVAQ